MLVRSVAIVGRAGAVCALLAVACHDSSPSNEPVVTSSRPRRTPPPTGVVRALPPHAIRNDGVGPYRLGESLATQLDELPSGPRLTLLDIPGVVHFNVIRAEQGSVLVGGDPLGATSFVAVVGADVARTEAGLAVGASQAQIEKQLRFANPERNAARDPRLSVPSDSPSMRLIFDGNHVLRGLVVQHTNGEAGTTDPNATAGKNVGPGLCLTHANMPGTGSAVGSAVGSASESECSAASDIVKINGEDVLIRPAEATRPPIAAKIRGLLWTAIIEIEGRDTLLALSRQDSQGKKAWSLVALRVEQGKFVRLADQTLYSITSENARWIGAELANIDVVLELTAQNDNLLVGGFMIATTSARIRDLVPLLPVTVRARLVPRSDPRPGQDASPL